MARGRVAGAPHDESERRHPQPNHQRHGAGQVDTIPARAQRRHARSRRGSFATGGAARAVAPLCPPRRLPRPLESSSRSLGDPETDQCLDVEAVAIYVRVGKTPRPESAIAVAQVRVVIAVQRIHHRAHRRRLTPRRFDDKPDVPTRCIAWFDRRHHWIEVKPVGPAATRASLTMTVIERGNTAMTISGTFNDAMAAIAGSNGRWGINYPPAGERDDWRPPGSNCEIGLR